MYTIIYCSWISFYRFGENKGSYCVLASFNDKENVIEVTNEVEDMLQEEVKDTSEPSDKAETPVTIEGSLKEEVKEEKKEEEPSTDNVTKDTKQQVSALVKNVVFALTEYFNSSLPDKLWNQVKKS